MCGLPHKKEPPEQSRGFLGGLQLALLRLFLSGRPGGCRGTGISRSDGPAHVGCPNPTRAIRDGQHILSFSARRGRWQYRCDPTCASEFPGPSPVGALFRLSQFARGRGVSGETQETLFVLVPQRAPVIASADRGLFLCTSVRGDPAILCASLGTVSLLGRCDFRDRPPPSPLTPRLVP
jgi:hypothetical protein